MANQAVLPGPDAAPQIGYPVQNMLAALAAAVLISQGDSKAVDSLAAFLGRSSWLSISFTYEFGPPEGEPAVKGKGELKVGPDNRLHYALENLEGFTALRQSGTRCILLDPGEQEYIEFEPLQRIYLPEEMSPTLRFLFPRDLADLSGRTLREQGWQASPAGLRIRQEDAMGQSATSTLGVAADGSPLFYELVVIGGNSFRSRMDIVKIARTAQPDAIFKVDPPVGWMPEVVRKAAQPVPVGEKVDRFTGFYNGLAGTRVEMKSLMGSKGAVLVFVGSDCLPSSRLLGVLPDISRRLEREGLKTTRIFLGRPNIAGAYWDSNGEAERFFGISQTPYLLRISKDMVVASAYSGFGSPADSVAPLVRTLLETADKPANE